MTADAPGVPFFLVDVLPTAGEFLLGGSTGRHAAAARRVRPGELLVLTDGRGSRAGATVLRTGRSEVLLAVAPAVRLPDPSPRVVLVQALPKGERSDLAVELATEAGVDEIVPWAAARCVARWTAERADKGAARWLAGARAAAEQSRRSAVPIVHDLADMAGVASLIAGAAGALILHEAGSQPIREATLPTRGELILVVGPEGGIDPAELDAFTAAGGRPVVLGPQVLRTSTAAAVALGALGVLTGRWAPTADPGNEPGPDPGHDSAPDPGHHSAPDPGPDSAHDRDG